MTHSANTWINVRFRVTGANGTTLAARAWADGAAETNSWQYSATDSAASLQGSGSFALLAYVAGNTSNGPVLVSFDDWTVKP